MFDWFKKKSSWNALAAKALARCEHDLKGASYWEFVQALPVLQRQAVLLTHLDEQVRNGGFYQWIHNGFAVYVDEVSQVLGAIGSETAAKVRSILEELRPLINTDKEDLGSPVPPFMLNVEAWNVAAVRQLMPDTEEEADEDLGLLIQPWCFERDNIYFEAGDLLRSDIETWFDKQRG